MHTAQLCKGVVLALHKSHFKQKQKWWYLNAAIPV